MANQLKKIFQEPAHPGREQAWEAAPMNSPAMLWLMAAFQASSLVPTLRAGRALKATMLVGAHGWAVAAVAAWPLVTLAEIFFAAPHPWLDHAHYAAAAFTLCPLVAVLGAKRPGMSAWHFVVAVLLVVLLLPVFQSSLRGRGFDRLILEDVWLLLFVCVTTLAVANYLPTGFAPAAGVLGLSLVLSAFSLSPWAGEVSIFPVHRLKLGVAAGPWIAWACVLRRQRSHRAATPWDRVWLDFRDLFGLAWGKRVQERWNAAAAQFDWPLRLTWWGFVAVEKKQEDKQSKRLRDQKPETSAERSVNAAEHSVEALLREPGPMQNSLFALLRRFVSPSWIDERLSAQ